VYLDVTGAIGGEMFIGHFGVALAVKKVAPRTSLGSLILAAEFLDLLWPIFLLCGIEHVEIVPGITKVSPFDFTDYPISHSLVMVFVWSALLGGIYYAFKRYWRGAWILAGAVTSHWILDFIVHRPDLPLRPGGETRLGLGLWNSWPASITVEILFFGAGVWIYLSSTHARDNVGRYGLWSMIGLLFFGWITTLFAGVPPDVRSVAWGALTMWLTVPWARLGR
jgi:hypothetical protein